MDILDWNSNNNPLALLVSPSRLISPSALSAVENFLREHKLHALAERGSLSLAQQIAVGNQNGDACAQVVKIGIGPRKLSPISIASCSFM